MFWTSSPTGFYNDWAGARSSPSNSGWRFPPPGNTFADDTVVIVKCEPDDFAERDFGMRHR